MDSLTFVVFILTGLAEISLPVLLGYYVVRKFKVKPKLMVYAAALYVVTQVVIIVASLSYSQLSAMSLSTPMLILTLGIISGGIEEVMRYLTLKYVLKTVRSWGNAIGFGVGWGSLQAVFIGLGLVLSVLFINYLASIDTTSLNTTEEFTEQVDALVEDSSTISVLDAVNNLVWVASMLVMQLAWSAAVMVAVTENRRDLFALALTSHSIVDASVTYLIQYSMFYPTGVLALGGVMGLYALRRLRC